MPTLPTDHRLATKLFPGLTATVYIIILPMPNLPATSKPEGLVHYAVNKFKGKEKDKIQL